VFTTRNRIQIRAARWRPLALIFTQTQVVNILAAFLLLLAFVVVDSLAGSLRMLYHNYCFGSEGT